VGLTHVTVGVSDLHKQGTPYEGEFLVDTGAMDCMAPRDKLEAAGVQIEGKKLYELASGDPIEYEYGYARLSFFDDETVSRIIFGPPGIEPILGVIALESVGVVVDPKTQNLKRLPALPLKRLGSK
jgi:predicted aspartyl protease